MGISRPHRNFTFKLLMHCVPLVEYNMAYISLQACHRTNNKLSGLILPSKYNTLLINNYLISKWIFKMVEFISEINYKCRCLS